MVDRTLLLVDGSSYLYRAYHALPDLRGPGGVPTGAIRGVVSMMKLLREQYPAAHGACVFDDKGKTFRDDWYPEYKATRTSMPDDLALQIEPIHEAVKLLGWPVLMVPGIEADDAIGTISCMAAKGGFNVVISTGDKDLAQLVRENVVLINTMSNERLDVEGVAAKFGVPPERIVDYLALIGDSVDNVPGVDKVGPKTAAKWIAEHGSLEGVMAAAPTMKGVVGENLRKALDWLPQGRRLVTVVTDCDLSGHVMGWPEFDALALREIEVEPLLAFYDRYGFASMRKELEVALGRAASAPSSPARAPAPPLDAPDAVPAAAIVKHYETVTTLDALDRWIARVEAAELSALDLETDSLDPIRARLIGLSLSVAPGEACYVPLAHSYAGAPDQLALEVVLARLRPWLENPAAPKVGHNTKYDAQVLVGAGIAVQGYAHDTMLESYVVEAHKAHTLESLAFRHLGRTALTYEDVCGKGASQIPFAQVEIERAAAYSCEDADMALHVHQALWPRIEADAGLVDVYRRIELPTSAILGRIERAGVLIDSTRLAAQSQELAERMSALEQEAFDIAGQPFNLGSPKQIGEILFGKLGLPVGRKTASGAPSTDEDVLQELALNYPLPGKLLEHRSLSKLKGTYTDKLPLMVNPATGRVHTNYAQAVAVTGRLSSNDPNLQNIPIRTVEGRRIREAFIAPAGSSILSADYSQIELRIMAHISADAGLLAAFGGGIDIHRATAAEVFAGGDLDAVTAEQRRFAKVINFGLIYGMSAFGLAANLGIERSAAVAYIERYFARYPSVKRYMDETRALAAEKGYVTTLFGRRVYLPEINKPGPRKSAAERQAINAPMQGTAADLIKLAMIAVQELLDREQRATRMIMQVHDELVFEVPEAELAWAKEAVPRVMAGVATLAVPLVAEVGVGANWDEAH
jgi:DNA polymerase-1